MLKTNNKKINAERDKEVFWVVQHVCVPASNCFH